MLAAQGIPLKVYMPELCFAGKDASDASAPTLVVEEVDLTDTLGQAHCTTLIRDGVQGTCARGGRAGGVLKRCHAALHAAVQVKHQVRAQVQCHRP